MQSYHLMIVYDANFDHNLAYERRRGGGGEKSSRKYGIKKGGTYVFTSPGEEGGLSPPPSPLPPPLFINNDQSLIEDVDKMQWLVNYEKCSLFFFFRAVFFFRPLC